jgi:hypothetical protein
VEGGVNWAIQLTEWTEISHVAARNSWILTDNQSPDKSAKRSRVCRPSSFLCHHGLFSDSSRTSGCIGSQGSTAAIPALLSSAVPTHSFEIHNRSLRFLGATPNLHGHRPPAFSGDAAIAPALLVSSDRGRGSW